MVRGSGGVVAATIALLQKRHNPRRSRTDNVDSSMDESTVKCTSSTDSGKDDNSITTSNSSTSSCSDKECSTEVVEISTVGCSEDFHWVGGRRGVGGCEDVRGRRRRCRTRESCGSGTIIPVETVRRRKGSSSLDRERDRDRGAAPRLSRRERDQKSRSACWSGAPPRPPPPPCLISPCQNDYYHFYRPFPCECTYRYMREPTTELEEQLRRLESDKESLSLQVAVLTDQVEAQSEKINDLEKTIAEQKRQISSSDDLLQREMLTRSSLETQKLELLAVVSELKRQEAALERDNLELRERLSEERRKNKPPLAPRAHLYPTASTPTNTQVLNRGISPSPSPVSVGQSPRKPDTDPETTPVLHRLGGGHYRSLPRERSDGDSSVKKGVMFGRASLSHDEARCSSVPNLAETESVVVNDSEVDGQVSNQEASPSIQSNLPKGIRKIFGKVKRSGSGNLDDLPGEDSFVRGGVRSTAGPRLCTSSQISLRTDVPFSEWTVDNVCDWLREMGLESCINDARRWVKSGQTLLSAPPQEIDKELNIKGGLLRKKLHLALHCKRDVSDKLLMSASKLDSGWVLRWLDDIGLPQYKQNLMSSRLDGSMLHRLTIDDVHSLHITSALHLASIRTGIHVLRKENYDPGCLIRRSDPENDRNDGEERVELWTNHRVMEWLRVVDLSEYAPNLRGSGVHGGLMVHEDKFTATLLASLLSIPPEKTLLRRHLSTHFTQLVGSDVIQQKRVSETSLGYIPLTTSVKIKPPKKAQFTLKRKKSKFDLDDGELVCPLNDSGKSSQTTEVSKPRGCLP